MHAVWLLQIQQFIHAHQLTNITPPLDTLISLNMKHAQRVIRSVAMSYGTQFSVELIFLGGAVTFGSSFGLWTSDFVFQSCLYARAEVMMQIISDSIIVTMSSLSSVLLASVSLLHSASSQGSNFADNLASCAAASSELNTCLSQVTMAMLCDVRHWVLK